MTSEHQIDTNEKISRKRWDEAYRKGEYNIRTVDEHIPSVAEQFKQHSVCRVLDLGCGSGRHVAYLVQQGFEVYGLDISSEGIKKARAKLKELGIIAHLEIGSIYNLLPYPDQFFDAVICVRTLNHGRITDIRRTIREIARVLVPGGLVFVTVRKRISGEKRLPYVNIAPRTYAPTEGRERGIVHYLFTKALLCRAFRNFKILDFSIDKERGYYCLLGELE